MATNPNPFSPTERDYLRAIMGYPILFSSSNAVFENVMNSIDGLYSLDGGATQTAIRSNMAFCQAVEAQIVNLQNLMLSSEITNEIKIDAIRNEAYLRFVVGPNYINKIAIRFSMWPSQAYFAAAPISPAGQAIIHRLDM
jgi:hypothetical protein